MGIHLLDTRVDKVLTDCLKARFFNLFPHVETKKVSGRAADMQKNGEELRCTGPVQDVQRQMSIKVLCKILSRASCFGVPRTELVTEERRGTRVPGVYSPHIGLQQRVPFDSHTEGR